MKFLQRFFSLDWKVLLLFILFFGGCLRLFHLGGIPNSLYVDEVAIGLDAKVIADTGKDMHGRSIFTTLFPSYGDYKLPVYIWLAAVSVRIFGPTEFAVRLPSAVSGILQIGVIALLAFEFFGRNKKSKCVALGSAVVLAVSPWSIVFSRTGFEGHLGQFFLCLGALILLYARKKPWLYVPAAVAGIAALYSYFSIRFVFPVVWIFFLLEGKVWRHRYQWLMGLGALCFWALFLIPMMKSPLYAPSNQYRLSSQNILMDESLRTNVEILRNNQGNSLFSRLAYRYTFELGKKLADQYSSHLDLRYLFLHGDANLRHGTQRAGLFLVVSLPFFLFGGWAIMRKYPSKALLLLGWWLIALLPASVPLEVPHALRSLNALTPISILIAYGVAEVWLARLRFGVWLKLAVIVLSVVNFSYFVIDYFVEYPKRSANAWEDGKKQLAVKTWSELHSSPQIERAYVNGGDTFFLWMLFYGPLSSQQIQQLPEQGYHKQSFGKIRFERYWNTVHSTEREPGVVFVADQFSEFPSTIAVEKIQNTPGEFIYGAATIKRN